VALYPISTVFLHNKNLASSCYNQQHGMAVINGFSWRYRELRDWLSTLGRNAKPESRVRPLKSFNFFLKFILWKLFSFIFHAMEVLNSENEPLFLTAFALNAILSVKYYIQSKISVAKRCRRCRKIMIFSETNLALISWNFCQKFRGNR